MYVGGLMVNILHSRVSPLVPWCPKNISYVDEGANYKTFRADVIGRSDLVLRIRSNGHTFTSLFRFFESIGVSKDDIKQGEEYECSSDVERTILLYDTRSYFSCKVRSHLTRSAMPERSCTYHPHLQATHHFSRRDPKFVLYPYTWFPEVDCIHELTIRVTPGDYTYMCLIHPLRFTTKIEIPVEHVPQPPPGYFVYTISYTLAPRV